MATASGMTLDQFLAIPSFDEKRLELIDGEVWEKPMPAWDHGRIAIVIGAALNSAEPRAMIPATGDFDESTPLPDVAFYRDSPPGKGEWMTRPPHVAIEILSPGQSRREMRTKIALYAAFGVESVWIVDPESELVEVYEGGSRRIVSGDETLASPSVPGFAMNLREIFA